jgi:Reverse transcriptase (RNA-dependent DNA polymerase)
VYVDDLLLMGSPAQCSIIARRLQSQFQLTSLGPVKYILGMEVHINYERRIVFFSQSTYIKGILKMFHMTDCHGVATPESKHEASEARQLDKDEDMPYRSIVGKIQYLVSCTRPDLAHANRHLGQFNHCYEWKHFVQAKRVLRYLKQTEDYGLLFQIQDATPTKVDVYTDSNYADDGDRRSVMGYATQIDGCTVSYKSKKQEGVALSTTEAEYVAMCEGARDSVFIKRLCIELGATCDAPNLLCDNTSAVFLSNRPGKHNTLKHVDIKYHYTRQLVNEGKLIVKHIDTEDQVADIFTKPLARVKFEKFRGLLGVVPFESWMSASN